MIELGIGVFVGLAASVAYPEAALWCNVRVTRAWLWVRANFGPK